MACRVSNLEEIYFPDKESLNQILLSFPSEEYRRVVLSLMVTLKDGKPTNLDNSFFAYNENYQQAVRSVTSLSDEKSLMFQNNVTQLAAAKSEKFKNAKANITPEQQKALAKTMNRYQAAEYNAIVHRARVADQWETFQGERHLYPNLQWIRSRSASPREAHLVYAGRIWPMDDPFWQTNSPGCVWNCKCSWRTTDAPTTDNSGVIPAKPAPGLEGNPFVTDKLITENHPYFEGIDKHIPSVGVLNNPDDICYIPKVYADGYEFKVHFLAIDEFKSSSSEFLPILKKAGYSDVKFLPIINTDQEVELRKRYFGKYFNGRKSPDCFSNDSFIELKHVTNTGYNTRPNILRHIKDVAKKADHGVIIVDKKYDFEIIAKDAFKKYKNLTKLVFYCKDEISIYTP